MGPKKGPAARAGSKNKPKPPPAEISISDFVAAGEPKGKSKAADRNRTGHKDGKDEPSEEPKKPTARVVIGGASWTGKLPVNMLSEHCQKQKWEKPEYTMTKAKEGFVSSVILKKSNPKTKETITLPPMRLPPAHQHLAACPTAMEARHFAAAYALFRVCSMRNLHMMMPPTYRNLWKDEFTQLKNAHVKEGKSWLYEADPFSAMQEREHAAAELAKKRAELEKERVKALDPKFQQPGLNMNAGNAGDNGGKRWSQAPKVEMGSKVRRTIEELVRQKAIWNPYKVRILEPQKRQIVEELSGLGFRRSHVEEAVSECKDREEVLEWLLIHIPEDDLPAWSLPEGYTAGISLASGDLSRESKVKRLSMSGFSTDFCAEVLDKMGGNEHIAAEQLQHMLLHGSNVLESDSPTEETGAWEEEQFTLEAIYGERYIRLSPIACEVISENQNLPCRTTFYFQKQSTAPYPNCAPVLTIVSKEIPAYVRLSAIRQAIQHANKDLLGEPMIFNVVEWLEENLPRILENPGKLRTFSVESLSHARDKSTIQNCAKSTRKSPKPQSLIAGTPQSREIRKKWESKQTLPAQQKMLRARRSLPAWDMQKAINQAVHSHQVTIISGETGSGKSTQSVQFILDDMIKRDLGSAVNIVCTQPRRISALGLADRVSDERCSSVGDEVGYIVRGDSKVKYGTTKITFMTTGVLLRRMQTSGQDVVSSFADISHVVVDEVHERSLDTDFLLALLRDVLRHRKDLKLILMSATLDADIFTQYFGGDAKVGRVNISGRTFPVEDLYLDDVVRRTGFNPGNASFTLDEYTGSNDGDSADTSIGSTLQKLGMGINYDLIASTVRYIDSQLKGKPGGILIFLPGTMEIDRCLAALNHLPFVHLLPLHASLLPSEQRQVFLPAPLGKRKVIAATNVAETSITIEDVVAVIDTGRVKETRYGATDNIVHLEEVWASQAACKQRRGRAGRVSSGTCYKMYTRKAEANMAPRPEPEIRRVPLEQLCLSVKAMSGIQDVAAFLANTLTPPENLAIEGALELLHRIGALDNQQLTALGRYISIIPTDLRLAKLMVYGAIFGCLESCLTIAAILTVKSPFVSPRDKREEAKQARASFSTGDGDLLIDLAAYQQWSERVKQQSPWETQSWCNHNFLVPKTLREISSNRSQLLSSLKDIGIIPVSYRHTNDTANSATPNRWNSQNSNTQLLRALIAGAFNPQIARISFPDKKFAASMSGTIELDPDARTIKYFNQENGRVFVHPSSSLFDAQSFSGSATYVSYFAKMATSKVFIRDLTPFNAYSLLLFSGPITLDTLGRGVLVDGWQRLRGWARIGVLASRLRMLLDEALAQKMDNPGLEDMFGEKVIDVVRHLVVFNGQDQ
ncbi:ATP-dependent RNA helicase DHX8 [Histoplasma capsulatum var. duboisii H88]|uniref:RNA helicase n=1 Tax=Ajellomyces capsulatus (strain H88) TaxID=544711 RepID=A0A8A1LBK2_AJEC8|nr:ATP-dependent RNA helicase DHX8 [Histoplasma capsulatum var. duboisii H88]